MAKTAERAELEEAARLAVRKWLRLRRPGDDGAMGHRLTKAQLLVVDAMWSRVHEAELAALGALAALRPSKSLVVDGVRYKAVTSRRHVEIVR